MKDLMLYILSALCSAELMLLLVLLAMYSRLRSSHMITQNLLLGMSSAPAANAMTRKALLTKLRSVQAQNALLAAGEVAKRAKQPVAASLIKQTALLLRKPTRKGRRD